MGIWHAVRDLFSVPTLSAQFSADETEPQPIDRMFVALLGGGSAPRVGRTEALSVPAVQRGRNLICSISTLPLIQVDRDRKKVANPLFEQIDPDVPDVVTLAQTVEDLLFEGISWWRVTGFGWDGYPTRARHLDVTSVSVEPPDGRKSPAPLPSGVDPRGAVVWVDGTPVPVSEIIRFDSPNPGLLKVAGRPLRRAILLDKAASMYAENPAMRGFFTPADGVDPEPEEIEKFLGSVPSIRQGNATGYISGALKYNSIDVISPADLQLVDLQKQAALEIANALGLDPEDLGVSTTSRTYQNAVDRRQDRINDVLSPYMRAITDRLSMGDVTKRGHKIVFDLDDYMKADPRTRWEVYKTANEMGAMTLEEIRAEEGLPELTGPVPRPTPSPAPAAPERPALAAGGASVTLSSDEEATWLTFSNAPTAAADENARTITGLAIPYGQLAISNRRRIRFAPGSLQFADISRVKLLREHDWTQAVGKAVSFTEAPEGVFVAFKVARGPEGDRVLALAADGVLDGLSVGVDFNESDAIPDPLNRGALLVKRASLREVSLTPRPAFDDSRVMTVTASRSEGDLMDDATTEPTAPAAPDAAPEQVNFSMDELADKVAARLQPSGRQVVNPTRLTASLSVSEPVPYRFDRGGNFVPTEHVFSADLNAMARAGDGEGLNTDAGRRVMGLLQATFATATTDVNELNPNINRPDMYVDQQAYRYPLWNAINKGAPPNGVQPFTFPKYNSSSGLVGDHTEGVEPSAGSFTTTNQTVTPTPISGKAVINREAWDMGGNPAVSTLIWNKMIQGWREGLENAAAAFISTLTSATDIALGVAPADQALVEAWEAALADLQFERGYDFSTFAVERALYKGFVAARDTAGRPFYAQIAPQNANGVAATRFRTLDLGGVVGVPNWALPSSGGAPNNSWLFDPSTVHGWASAPQRLEFQYQVKSVELGIWGYKAFANTDIGGVRQVSYDATA